MSSVTSNFRKGFTLVEILIVVIILGILAAIVIPQFSNASENARISSLQSTLQTLRSQIELYKLQHGDVLPNIVTNWDSMLTDSTYGSTTFIPYLQTTPVNAINNFSNVMDANTNLTTNPVSGVSITTACGFVYDYESGSPNASGLIYGTDATGKAIAGIGSGASFSPY